MKIKICGLFRKDDIDYINEARPDYAGFIFAESRRQVLPVQAERLRQNLTPGIVPVGVFVNAPAAEIASLYRGGVIGIAQLHGTEEEEYITRLKEECGIPVIKVYKSEEIVSLRGLCGNKNSDFLLIDSGAGSGKTFNWDLLKTHQFNKPWFLAGGITLDNIQRAIALNPYGIDVSSAAETEGIKDREKIIQLTATIKRGNKL